MLAERPGQSGSRRSISGRRGNVGHRQHDIIWQHGPNCIGYSPMEPHESLWKKELRRGYMIAIALSLLPMVFQMVSSRGDSDGSWNSIVALGVICLAATACISGKRIGRWIRSSSELPRGRGRTELYGKAKLLQLALFLVCACINNFIALEDPLNINIAAGITCAGFVVVTRPSAKEFQRWIHHPDW